MLPVDLAANAESLGADGDPRARRSRSSEPRSPPPARPTGTTVVHVETDPLAPVPGSESWWDVPVAEVAALDSHPAGRARPTTSHKREPAQLPVSERRTQP